MKPPIRVALFGNGFARTVMLPCLRHCDGIILAGISSPNLERVRATASAFGVESAAADHREILERARPDLVFIATPPYRHAQMAIDSLRAGCHVICEKPAACSASETDAMLQAARAAPDQLALIDHQLRFHPARAALRELVEQGHLGPIHHATYTYHSSSRRAPDLPWDWKSDAGQGGGLLGAIGSHAIDSLRVLLGEVVEVRGNLETLLRRRRDPKSGRIRAVTSDDLAVCWLRFDSGAFASVMISGVEAERRHRITLSATTGAARLDEQGPFRVALDEGAMREREVKWDAPTCGELGIPDTDWARCYLVFARRIIAALSEGRIEVPGAATFEDGHRTQIVLDAIRESSHTGDRITIRSVRY
jgi:predicted dehydrogenase